MLNTDNYKNEKQDNSNKNDDCFIAEKDNSYPLCVGRGWKKCNECQLYTEWDVEYYE